MFSLYSFKQFLILTYTQMFNFMILEQYSVEKKDLEIQLSKLIDIDVQLFTSDELAIKSIESEYYFFIFQATQYFVDKGIDDLDNKKESSSYYQKFWRIFNHIKYSGM